MRMKKVSKRRRKENKTDYAKRLKLLKSGLPRVVFRKSNRYVTAQYVTSSEAQDKVELSVNSKQLLGYGWPKENVGSLKTTPAEYLTGYLIGKEIVKKKFETPIVDFGMHRSLHKAGLYSFLKGLIDAGVKMKADKKVFPGEDRIKGKHMKKDFSATFEKIKSQIDKK